MLRTSFPSPAGGRGGGEGGCKTAILQNIFKPMTDEFEICFHGLDEYPRPPAGEGSMMRIS